jgi:hypothetical protein
MHGALLVQQFKEHQNINYESGWMCRHNGEQELCQFALFVIDHQHHGRRIHSQTFGLIVDSQCKSKRYNMVQTIMATDVTYFLTPIRFLYMFYIIIQIDCVYIVCRHTLWHFVRNVLLDVVPYASGDMAGGIDKIDNFCTHLQMPVFFYST